MSPPDVLACTCDLVMSTARVRCPDCQAIVQVPYSWCPVPTHSGFGDDLGRVASAGLVAHALDMPVLHPTLLPEHHAIRRPA